MTLAMSADTIAYYQREADRRARGMQQYGGNAAIVELRCFKWYHPDSGSWLTAPDGRQRWFGPKTMRIYAILHRLSSGGRMTMGDIASEAMCCTSTVSRAVQRLQAFGFFAIDITRGRNGGITVRKRQIADQLKHYAEAAWARIRSWINVASTHKEGGSGPEVGTNNLLPTMDATFSGVCSHSGDEAELRRMVLAGEYCTEASVYATQHDRERLAYEDFAHRTITEIRKLDAGEPDWDLYLEAVRASYGMG